MTILAVLIGTAKQIPCAAITIAVFIPITSAWDVTNGPPELPGFKAASVWIIFSISLPDRDWKERPNALITPVVTVVWKP